MTTTHAPRLRGPNKALQPVVLVIALLSAAGCSKSSSELQAVPPAQATTTTTPCAAQPRDQGGCGPTFEEQRALNLRYAERLAFTGDLQQATATAEEVRGALAPLAGIRPSPSVDDVRAALGRWGRDVEVSGNAVRTAGTAFAVSVQGGCVFGALYDGALTVEVGGYVRDGGCLASYGH